MSTKPTTPPDVRESIEARPTRDDVDMKDASMSHHDVDAEGDEDIDLDMDVEMAEGGNADADAGDDHLDMYHTIQSLSTYLCKVQEDGEELAAGFQRIPNRRVLPDYFEIIAKPVAFSTIRHKLQKKQYASFTEFVKDVAQICHNAQVYNRPSAPIFGAAVRLRAVFIEELNKLVAKGEIRRDEANLPDLGELPPAEESVSDDPEDEEDEEDEEEADSDHDNEDDYDSDDETGRRPRRRGQRSSLRDPDFEDDSQKRRGRPPMVLTPNEARISSLLRGLRKPRDETGTLLVLPFEKLPDRVAMPDYFQTITQPIALDNIKKKAKRKKYQNVDHAMEDLELMFENAKAYNEDESELYQAAVELQRQARMLAQQEKARPDDEFRDEDGKLPLAEIMYNGQSWKVGDWVHIRNPNDLAKPIVAQIYRTWQDRAGQRWINACWYYRPEQTVHRFEKYFYEREVVKTGQYRDHQIEDVLDRCFVMFVTRFNRGRPRGFPTDKEVYVCESRYNEEKFRFAKIKTWASCVPDEVRDKDYEMDLFEMPRRIKKMPSPIKHLLRDDAKETDELPKPTWGSPNAPPIVGAVHRRPRETNESPPPEPTPPPQPAPVLVDMGFDASRRASMLSASQPVPGDLRATPAPYGGHVPSPSPGHYSTHMTTPHFQPVTPGSVPPSHPIHQTPVPIPQMPHHVPPQASVRPVQFQHHQPGQPQPSFQQGYAAQFVQSPAPPMPLQSQMTYAQNSLTQPSRPSVSAATPGGLPTGNMYNPPRPPEIYTLPDSLNEILAPELRGAFQRDEAGRVLFFTAPPLDRPHKGIAQETTGLGHSIEYVAGRREWLADRDHKRKMRDEAKSETSYRHRIQEKDAQDTREDVTRQATNAMAVWLSGFDQDSRQWIEESGLEGWRERLKNNNIMQE